MDHSDHIDQAIYDTVHNSDLSAKQIAPLLGTGHQVLLNKANPQSETHKMTLREAVAIQLVTGNHAIYRAMGMELSIKAKQAAPLGILESVLKAGKEHGDVLTVIHKSMEDGRLSMREQEQCQREITEAIEALMDLREAVLEHSKKQIKG
ncbi:phage regulatory CII family protein [Marinomonas rhizomae]|uniref:phage regulatory CII family protein n=1 Tax=Marinomonas rhizomae TaxID=491948 RepID=UPI002103EEB4|nr:phage regulatory CII family protein [Marinomonas rhizomae]UTW01201.1 phage regulatory CII family protein [Marinomonas rhizomae]